MECITAYLNTLPTTRQERFAKRCGTTVGYLRKAVSAKQKIREFVVINMERESGGAIRCELVRDDVDWAYLRGTAKARRAS
jgi:DNA-binding transcriptional regulator YdaS (Cro superfamily)